MTMFQSLAPTGTLPAGIRARAYHDMAGRAVRGEPMAGALRGIAPAWSLRGMALGNAAGKIDGGTPVGTAMSGLSPQTDLQVISAGEEAGDVAGGLHNAAFLIVGQAQVRRAILAEGARLLPMAAAVAWIAAFLLSR